MSRVEAHAPTGIDQLAGRTGPEASRTPDRPLPARVLVGVVHAYQAARSGRPTGCRFLPTCSDYAIEAIDRQGAVRGTLLAAGRLARCTPWGGHGIDPVPDRRTP